MTIDEAIIRIGFVLSLKDLQPQKEFQEALHLSIEALKRCKALAENNPLFAAKPLPGETEE